MSPIILVGVDYSEPSSTALLRAFDYAEARSGELHAVHVLDPSDRVSDSNLVGENEDPRLREFVGNQLKFWMESHPASKMSTIVLHIVAGRPANEIVELAADLNAEVVVVGTHGRNGVKRILLGSVAERLVRLCSTPILVIPHADAVDTAVPAIAPPCPQCVEARRASGGKELWCEEHSGRHGRRHTHHYVDRNVEANASDSLLIRV